MMTLGQARAQPSSIPGAGSVPLDPTLGIGAVRLWQGDAPGAKGDRPEDIPTLTVLLGAPHTYTGTAVIINPGGRYLRLVMNLEGREVADWFAARGVTAFILRYRLGPKYRYPVPLEDAERAVRWVRYHAREFDLDPNRVGMVGFSAGGHLAAMAGTGGGVGDPKAADPIDRLDSRPNFLVLGYPWLNAMQPDRRGFIPSYPTLMKLSPADTKAMEEKYDPVTHVTAHTPSTFIYATTTDGTVPVDATVAFYLALLHHRAPAELHLFRHGGHGTGLGRGDPALDQWPTILDGWLRAQGLLTPQPAIEAEVKADVEAARHRH